MINNHEPLSAELTKLTYSEFTHVEDVIAFARRCVETIAARDAEIERLKANNNEKYTDGHLAASIELNSHWQAKYATLLALLRGMLSTNTTEKEKTHEQRTSTSPC